MTAVDELIAFVRQQLDEDEGLARTAFAEHNDAVDEWHEPWSGTVEIGPHEDDLNCNDSGVSRHIVNWDPARVLAEVEAKRRILDMYADYTAERRHLAPVIWALAQPYAGREGWREEWRLDTHRDGS